MTKKKSIAIIGGGAAALSLASFLDGKKYQVTIYERNRGLGRKFLVAGKGGFNLTHSEPIDMMKGRYHPQGFLDSALLGFDNEAFRLWLDSIGIPTYVGTSKRVFPVKGIKPIEVLNKIKEHILSIGHEIKYEMSWNSWSSENNLIFNDDVEVKADIKVYCLGGGSWKITGSDGLWADTFVEKGLKVNPFVAANCAYSVLWNSDFIGKANGKPLKNIAISCGRETSIGEAVITHFGIEGNAVYALTNEIQSSLDKAGTAALFLDLKPMLSLSEIAKRINQSDKKITEILTKEVKLEKVKIQLLKSILSKSEFLNPSSLARFIKRLPITVHQAEKIDKAISTTGGVDRSEVSGFYEIKPMAQNYVIGEMLDWNAPTGGYLLQACFSMGNYLASHLNKQD